MILDHIKFFENTDIIKGKIKLSAVYQTSANDLCDIPTDDRSKESIQLELAKTIQSQMIKDLSGYFHDSFTDEDIFYISCINHTQLAEMRQLAEITKYMSVDQVQKILTIYALLADLGFISKE